MLRRISAGTYRINIRGREEIFTYRRLKPYVPYQDDKEVPLHYYTDREGLIETDNYVVERVLEDGVVRGKRQWRVKFQGFPEPQWHYAGSFMQNINDSLLRGSLLFQKRVFLLLEHHVLFLELLFHF